MEIDDGTSKVLDKVEDILKDRFSGYVIVAVDGDNIYSCFSSAILASGAADYLKKIAMEKWNEV